MKVNEMMFIVYHSTGHVVNTQFDGFYQVIIGTL